MPARPSLPAFSQAPVQHEFHRIEDFVCWSRPLCKASDFDCLNEKQPFRSSHRSLLLGALTLSHSHYSTDIRLDAAVDDLVLVTLNAVGSVRFAIRGTQLAPDPSAGVLVVTPSQGQYTRGEGGGLVLSTRPRVLLQTAQAMQGPRATRLLRERLQQPISFFSYGSGNSASVPLSLLQSLHLVDSLLCPGGRVPAALRLDDLICRQLVLMLCPELDGEEDPSGPKSTASFEMLLEWICSRLDQPMSLSDLERQSGYSRRALQRAFQNRFSCGPMQWLRQRRLELAVQQITQGKSVQSIRTIARRCGYLNLASFSRDFKNTYGQSPSQMLSRRHA